MTDLDQAVLSLLTYSPEEEAIINHELWVQSMNGIYKDQTFRPEHVTASLGRLVAAGKAEMIGDGYRKLPERPAKVDQQRSMFA